MKLSEIKAGMTVHVRGIDCAENKTVSIKSTPEGHLYFRCDQGKHFLDEEDNWPELTEVQAPLSA